MRRKGISGPWDPFQGPKKVCKTCLYCNAHSMTDVFCEYILVTGHQRQCSPQECKEKGIYVRVTPAQKRKLRAENVRKNHSPAPAPKEPERPMSLSMELQKPERAGLMYSKRKPVGAVPDPSPEPGINDKRPARKKRMVYRDPRKGPSDSWRCLRCHRAARVPGRALCLKCISA